MLCGEQNGPAGTYSRVSEELIFSVFSLDGRWPHLKRQKLLAVFSQESPCWVQTVVHIPLLILWTNLTWLNLRSDLRFLLTPISSVWPVRSEVFHSFSIAIACCYWADILSWRVCIGRLKWGIRFSVTCINPCRWLFEVTTRSLDLISSSASPSPC